MVVDTDFVASVPAGGGITRVEEFLERLKTVDHLQGIYDVLGRQLACLGFHRFAYFIQKAPAGKPIKQTLSSYPGSWLDHYKDSNYYNLDPVMTTAAMQTLPYTWQSLYDDNRAGADNRQVFDEAGEFGIRNGITFPIHGPEGAVATLSVSSDERGAEADRHWNAHRYDLQLIACYSHDAIIKCVLSASEQELVHLTQRERECLLWTARGKTTWEVSQLLSISEHTVIFHIKNATRKLDVYSKHHAVVKAILLGLILP